MIAPTTLHCTLGAAPGALERLLRVIRVRGFEIVELETKRSRDGYLVTVTLQGPRCAAQLLRHLANLTEVSRCDAVAVAGLGMERGERASITPIRTPSA